MKTIGKIVLPFVLGLVLIPLSGCKGPCPPAGPWPMPPWCGTSGEIPGTDGIAEFEYYKPGELKAVLAGPVFLVSPNFGKPETMMNSSGAGWAYIQDNAWETVAINNLHLRGLHLVGASMTIRHRNIEVADPKPELAALDINLNPIPLTKPGMSDYLPGEYFYSIFNPEWQELLLKQGRGLIDLGAEGIVIDEPNTYGSLVFEVGGSFDPYSMTGFRDYMRTKYTSDELQASFGIENVEEFDFRQYLIERNLQDTWNASDQNPLPITYEFFLFQNSGADAFLRRFAQDMQTYARDQYDRDFAFSYNSSPQFDFSHFLAADYLDYQTGEGFYFTDRHLQAALTTKLAENVIPGKVILLAEVGHDVGEIPHETSNLFKYIFADIYSTRNTGMIIPTDGIYTMRDGTYIQPFVQFNQNEGQRYVDFMMENSELFNLKEPARVAVVHSSPSEIANRLPTDERLYSSNGDLMATMQILFDADVPFNMLVSGDGLWAKGTLTLDDLNNYDVVVLPGVDLISDTEVQALVDYAKNGGVILQINNFGRYDSSGVPASRPDIRGLTDAPGAHNLGQGTWHTLHLWNDLGSYFWNGSEERNTLPTEHKADHPAAVAIQEALIRYYTPEIVSDAPITVTIRRYSNDSRIVGHLVNYDYDQTLDEFSPAGPFEVTLETGGLTLTSARLYDFEAGSVTEIPLTQAEGSVTFTITSLYAYSIVELLP